MRQLLPKNLLLSALLGLSSIMSLTTAADIGVWEVDLNSNDNNGCMARKDQLTKAYNEAAEIVENARRDLETVFHKRPPGDRKTKVLTNYDRVARAATVFFGMEIDPESGPERLKLWERANKVYEAMQSTLKDGKAPPRAIHKDLKPAFACGEKGWKWAGPNDDDPGSVETPKQKLSAKKKKDGSPEFPTGAWYWNNRYLPNEEGGTAGVTPGLCVGERTGITLAGLNFITWCDPVFKRSDLTSQKKIVPTKVGKTKLDDIVGNSVSGTMVHEFAHYFGNPLTDQQAVDKDGNLYWIGADGKATTTKPSGDKPQRIATYTFIYLANLAKKTIRDDKETLSVETADAYAYFGFAAAMDTSDFSANVNQDLLQDFGKRSRIFFKA